MIIQNLSKDGKTDFSFTVHRNDLAKTLDLLRRCVVAIKGPITTPVGSGFRSVNVALRKEFDLYANVRPAVTMMSGGRYEDIDLVLIRADGSRQLISNGCLKAGHRTLDETRSKPYEPIHPQQDRTPSEQSSSAWQRANKRGQEHHGNEVQ